MNNREGDSMTNKGEGVINLECDHGGRGREYDRGRINERETV